MGVLGILFGQKKTVIDAKETGTGGAYGKLQGILRQTIGGVAGIVIDATVSEDHNFSCEVTKNPVEDGAMITDHVQLNPAKLTINGVISDTPLGYAVIGNIQNVERSINELFGGKSRSVDAFNDLLALRKTRQPFTVMTGLKRYTNMILTDLSIPRTAATGRAIHFTAVMEEVQIVKSKTVTNTNLSSSVSDIGAKTKDYGQTVTDPVPQASQLSEDSNSLSEQSKNNVVYKLNKWW